ncbi:MAG TPA: HAD-IIB family hydrolase, partial [Silvibacterium sp.]|nr:HAD-IIB family hydrolase [Silvibacterium sp.]
MPSTVRLIAIDIDGTLLPTVGGQVTDRACSALREAEEAGIEIVIATGRRQAYAAPLIHPIGLAADMVLITSNGAVTRTLAGRRIDRVFLPIETAVPLCSELRRFGGMTVFTFDGEGPGELAVESIDRLGARIMPWVNANRPWIREFVPLERAFDSRETPVQGMICGSVAAMRAAEAELLSGPFAGEIELHRTEYAAKDLCILDILPPGCSKGVALKRWAASRGIGRERIMAIGDNLNDLEMLKFAGWPVAMANSAPFLLEIAQQQGWQIAASNDHDGVAEILESVLGSSGVWQEKGASIETPA